MLNWGAFTPDGRRVALIHQVDGPATGARRRSVAWPSSTWSTRPASGATKTIATADGMDFVLFRPPDGRELLYRARVDGKWGLFAMDLDGTNVRPIVPATVPSEMDMTFASATLLGRRQPRLLQHVHHGRQLRRSGCCQLFVVNADGTDLHKFVANAGDDLGWRAGRFPPTGSGSPSGTTCRTDRRTAVSVIAADGTGDRRDRTGAAGTAHWVWSPDSTKILMYPDDGRHRAALLLDPAGRPVDDRPLDVGRLPRLAAGRARPADRLDASGKTSTRRPGRDWEPSGALPRASMNHSRDSDAIECRAWPPWSRRIRGDRGPARPRRTGQAGRS